MSRKLSFKELRAQPAEAKDEFRTSSDSPANEPRTGFVLVAKEIRQPVEVARLLTNLGMSLRKAHDTLNRLAKGEVVPAALCTEKRDEAISALDSLGVAAAAVELPEPDVKKIRERIGLSQSDFALLYGLEPNTLRNWEQKRNELDAPTRIFFAILETHPNLVRDLLTGSICKKSDAYSGRWSSAAIVRLSAYGGFVPSWTGSARYAPNERPSHLLRNPLR
jgi:DNA-binding transcriptional regulator YiaG